VKGIEQFPNLKVLDVSLEPALTALDVSKNPALESLYLNDTAISSLDLSGNPALMELRCYNTRLTKLDISKNPGLIAAIQDGTVHPVDGVSTAELHVYQDNELAMDKALTIVGASIVLVAATVYALMPARNGE
jgi:Leucine-rich repeat (LRR) protein